MRDFPADSLEGRFIATCQDQIAAFGSQRAGDRQADTAAGAGDESGFATESTDW